jgi:UDP-4-amino-4-deoxy-L-arabinose formyltransferase/UDP-glucuronic acid dehydrogenase (UDP-4-keto-hexauronic acid decarboxylating)
VPGTTPATDPDPDLPPDARVAYATCTEAGHEALATLLAAGVPVTEVVSITPEAAERHGVCGYRSVEGLAADHGLDVYYPERYAMDTETDRAHFEALDADLLVVNGWQRLVPADVLRTFPRGAVGNHGSAFGLPKGRGRSPLNWSLVEGLDRFLLSLITLDPEPDAGGVVATRKFDVTVHDDIRTLYHKVTMAVEEMLLAELGALLRGEADPTRQDGEPTYYPKRNPADGAVAWEDTTADVYNLVRAVARPYPGAFTAPEGDPETRVMLWRARPFSDDLGVGAAPGTVVRAFDRGDFVVATGDGTLLVTDWEADGWAPETGDRLASLADHDRVDRPEHRDHLTGEGAPDP